MNDTRLIERWLPITAIGIESLRERTPMTPFPAPNRLHVWWARRPLTASRAAILASLLPADASQDNFLHILGIHGDPVIARRKMEVARRTGVRVIDPYGYPRAFGYVPNDAERFWITSEIEKLGMNQPAVLDPTAGGGSIPLESLRLGFRTIANDLNPVALFIEKATFEWPLTFGMALVAAYNQLASNFRSRLDKEIRPLFPQPRTPDQIDICYLIARTVKCPYCAGCVPLSPNWRLAPEGTGVKLIPHLGSGPNDPSRHVDFAVVSKASEQSKGTIADGDGNCPYDDCRRVISGGDVKQQAQAGQMGDQLYAVVTKRRVETRARNGKRGKDKWERFFRSPSSDDEFSKNVGKQLAEKIPQWTAMGVLPTEAIPDESNYDRGHKMYGMYRWTDMFSARQLLCHGVTVEVFRELLNERQDSGGLTAIEKAAFGYLAIVIDKMTNYSARSTRWDQSTGRVRSVFDSHNFAMVWSYAEMVPLAEGLGYDWALEQTGKCLEELVEMLGTEAMSKGGQVALEFAEKSHTMPCSDVVLSCKPGDALDHLADSSVDCVVIDPPYYDNVMYAELSDFFYVWLKRTAGHIYPELFRRQLTDKESEAVANPARFKGEKGAKALAGREYQHRMASIFAEMRRVLKPNGIMTLMFTHKATGAWDALTKGLMEAGFMITASWPINTEAEGSLHIKDKAAANSTIFLVCRPHRASGDARKDLYWEDVEPLVAAAVRRNVQRFREAGIGGVDLYLASFGPALEEFSKHWPLKRGTPRDKPEEFRRRRQLEMFEEEFDPYAVTPEDALDAARREVKRWKLEQLTHMKANAELDPVTSWFVLAWDAFRATVFDYDEALRLARAVGVDLDKDIIGWLAEKKGSDVRFWDSAARAAKGSLGPADGSRAMIDAIHHAAHLARTSNLGAARERLDHNQVDRDPKFFASLEAVLEVLPVSKAFSGVELEGDVAAQGSDFEVLENLRRLAFSDRVDEPKQLELWREETTA